MTLPLLSVNDVSKQFVGRGLLRSSRRSHLAVDSVSFTVAPGAIVGIIGESGSGKSTLARLIVRLLNETSGSIVFDSKRISTLRGGELRALRRAVQMVFQDSTGSLNPSLSIGRSVQLQAMAAGTDDALARTMACKMLDEVGLDHRQYFERLPHQLSGGQRQRVNIARALVTSPRLVVLDEPLSALDKTVEAQIMLLLARLRRQLGLTYVFITHDLAIAKGFCDEVVVLYRGRVLEQGPVQSVFEAPAHPYTAMLLAAQLSDDPESKNLQGHNPADDDMSVERPIEGGCAFASRCPVVRSDCATTLPGLRVVGPGHLSACLRSGTDVPRIRGEH